MSNIVAVLIVRCTHTGIYADGRPNPASVTLYDLDEITIQKNRTRSVPVPVASSVDIPMSTRTFISWHQGDICTFTKQGLITSEIILQLRDKGNCGGPAGTGQALRPAVLNVERVSDVLRMVIPDNVIPTVLDSIGFLEGEPVTITGLTGAFRDLNAEYEISAVDPGSGLAGAAVGSYLVEVPSVGADIAAATLAGVNLCLTEGRVVAQFGSIGDVGGLGDNVFGYIGGQLFPNAGGGGGALAIFDEGALVDPAVTSIDFIGAGVTATTAGAGAVDVTIPGGGGAPANAEYVVMSLDATLTDERVLTAGTGIAIVDGGANSPVTLSVDATLAEVLVNGNVTGGTDILVSSGDSIVGVTDLVLDPGGGGGDNVIIDGLTWPSSDGALGDVLTTDGGGNLSFTTPSIEVFTSGEALVVGDVLTLNTSGEVIRANSSIGTANWEVIGISAEAVGASVIVRVFTKSGSSPSTRFGAAPAGALNGQLVFLDTTSGQASTTPPSLNGNAFFTIGTLRGADGATSTPTIIFRPQLIALRS